MNTESIIAQIDAEISKLQQAKAILASTSNLGRSKGFASSLAPPLETLDGKPPRRRMSAESKANIATAQKARWAKVRKAAKKAVQA